MNCARVGSSQGTMGALVRRDVRRIGGEVALQGFALLRCKLDALAEMLVDAIEVAHPGACRQQARGVGEVAGAARLHVQRIGRGNEAPLAVRSVLVEAIVRCERRSARECDHGKTDEKSPHFFFLGFSQSGTGMEAVRSTSSVRKPSSVTT